MSPGLVYLRQLIKMPPVLSIESRAKIADCSYEVLRSIVCIQRCRGRELGCEFFITLKNDKELR